MTKKQQSFAEAMQTLEDIVRQLEQGDVPLENAIDLYKQGMELSQLCHNKLQHAEEQLVSIVHETGETAAFDPVKGEM
ncbi:exodeoxyribonuclease VII small subunit [Lysinibacillus piscis]|uniref:Exodeoxyribonuclease 7 small subunit n=1 Tax=Lysinibacillus piscis TaxID=2518931 RepID=A0ABQ5NK71_9BACI|nr:exodeoxyribonuclease VII small subunit [Lysinibacillus sp. KH24]GLC88767.1 exodeoxyribonuclease 7 small subunit [Lysinibacillus sp. KH24]